MSVFGNVFSFPGASTPTQGTVLAFIEQAVRAVLNADGEFLALVGGRLYPGEAPQGAPMPYVTYSITGERRDVEGPLVAADAELIVVDRVYSVAKRIAERARLALHRAQTVAAGTPIRGAFLDDRRHRTIPPADGSGRSLHSVESDLTIWYLE